jgi:hypothetical protein
MSCSFERVSFLLILLEVTTQFKIRDLVKLARYNWPTAGHIYPSVHWVLAKTLSLWSQLVRGFAKCSGTKETLMWFRVLVCNLSCAMWRLYYKELKNSERFKLRASLKSHHALISWSQWTLDVDKMGFFLWHVDGKAFSLWLGGKEILQTSRASEYFAGKPWKKNSLQLGSTLSVYIHYKI